MKKKEKVYSEKTIRQLDKYTRKLIKSLPNWLKNLFNNERIIFTIDDDGMLVLQVDATLDPQSKDNAGKIIGEYLEKTPCAIIGDIQSKVH